ncbi:MAG: YCF48-related protein, partial [Planctomycetes bacterium]|nr:YCF48-related protein [Planctomycetota bacterium]
MNRHDALQSGEVRRLPPGRHCRVRLLVFTWLVMGYGTPTLASEPTMNAEESLPVHGTMVGDAALTAIFFIDHQTGWAVGERGVIWHTRDGGATWLQQATPVRCRLNSVFFLDEQQGWAAGGAGRPFSHTSSGVVLRTEDGGNTWAEVPNSRLPMLTRVKCFDHEHGVAIGIGSSSAPSGVFATQDGGRSWQPHPANASGQWLAGDFLDPNRGAVAGMAGAFATVVDRQVTHSPLASRSLRSMHDMRLVPPTGGWLVGDGGLVMTTRDLGHSWPSPPADLSPDVADHFDFHAV